MSSASAGTAPIENRAQLIEWLESGEKPAPADWRIGTEHEKFGFHTGDLSPLPYDGPSGVRAMLEGLRDRFVWTPVMEGETIIGLKDPNTGASVSLEPGGQFELSGAPLATLHQTCSEVHTHLAQVRDVAEPLNIGFLGLGFSPIWQLADVPVMPKGRYEIMRRYMPTKGNRGLDMMFRTCTVQVNLDFATEADMVKIMRVGIALQPIATALFAYSPFTEGKPNGYLSLRADIWNDVDPDRTGQLPFVFEDGFSYERYVDYALDVPMYFVTRQGRYHEATHVTFRQYLDGALEKDLPGVVPTMGDWEDHLTTLFPETRLKRFIEMRGADGGPWRRLCALPAFWTGLIYDKSCLDAAYDLIKDWSVQDRASLRADVPKQGFDAKIAGRTTLEIADAAVDIAREGLKNRRNLDGTGEDETRYLHTLEDSVATAKTPACELLDLYHGAWKGDITRLFRDHAY